MQTRAVIGITDIHARSFPNSVQAFENLNGIGAVCFIFGGKFGRVFYLFGHRESHILVGCKMILKYSKIKGKSAVKSAQNQCFFLGECQKILPLFFIGEYSARPVKSRWP
jgi:hypothetical protein